MLHREPKLPVRQLIILSICRFAEPVVFTSVLPYLPEMMESVGVRKNEIAKWVGISSAVVASCQCVMAVPWGAFSDRFGRKYTILLGLTSTMFFSLLFGFSKSLVSLLVARAFLGLMNGNVGIIRTMVAELVPEKELQPRAFSIMPLVWTIGSIFGPAFGGALANPAVKHPEIFGDGWEIFKKFPFALPNILAALLFVVGITTGFLFLEETLSTRKHKRDYGLVLGQILTNSCTGRKRKPTAPYAVKHDDSSIIVDERTRLLLPPDNNNNLEDFEENTISAKQTNNNNNNNHHHHHIQSTTKKTQKRVGLKQVFTPQSSLVLMAYGMMALHSMAFDSLFPVFLHHPQQNMVDNPDVKLPFKFTGGFGVDSQTIGILYTLIGIIGMFVQFLIFPVAARRYGVLNCFKVVAVIFPILYAITPFTVLVPDAHFRLITVFCLMMTKLILGIFCFPCCTILLTNTASSLRILGTLNGVGTSVSAIGRASGPAIVGEAFTVGVKHGYAVVPWWILTALTVLGAVPIFWIVETDGFAGNIADEEEEEEEQDDDDYESPRDSDEEIDSR